MKNIKILITGSAGYIGGCLNVYLKNKFRIFNIDKKRTNQKNFFKINLMNKKRLNIILAKIKPDIIIHLAAESLVDPKKNFNLYKKNNILATNNLLECMKKNEIKKIIFSSTAAVYKEDENRIKENFKIEPKSNYAKTKIKCENKIIQSKFKFIIFRFFNVCSSLTNPFMGENHKPETHLIPLATEKSILKKKILINGKSYNTVDGTCVRDYIHIKDICTFIDKSIKLLLDKKKKSSIFNLGSGKGYTILEIIKKINKYKKLEYKFTKRRKGDPAILIADINKVKKVLKWNPVNSNLDKIIKDQFLWLKFTKKF